MIVEKVDHRYITMRLENELENFAKNISVEPMGKGYLPMTDCTAAIYVVGYNTGIRQRRYFLIYNNKYNNKTKFQTSLQSCAIKQWDSNTVCEDVTEIFINYTMVSSTDTPQDINRAFAKQIALTLNKHDNKA